MSMVEILSFLASFSILANGRVPYIDEDIIYFRLNFSFAAAVEIRVVAMLHMLEYFIKKRLLEIFKDKLFSFINWRYRSFYIGGFHSGDRLIWGEMVIKLSMGKSGEYSVGNILTRKSCKKLNES